MLANAMKSPLRPSMCSKLCLKTLRRAWSRETCFCHRFMMVTGTIASTKHIIIQVYKKDKHQKMDWNHGQTSSCRRLQYICPDVHQKWPSYLISRLFRRSYSNDWMEQRLLYQQNVSRVAWCVGFRCFLETDLQSSPHVSKHIKLVFLICCSFRFDYGWFISYKSVHAPHVST